MRTASTSRREFIGTSLGAAAALALTPPLLRALQPSDSSFSGPSVFR